MAPTTTTMQELCRRVPQNQQEFFARIVQIVEDNFPMGWDSWEVQDLSYADLFGEQISPKMEAKLRFALPTYELAIAFSPGDPSLSEKKYRLIKRKLLEWPLGRALLYAPHGVMEKIHSKSYDRFIETVKLLKPRLTSRDVASNSITQKRSSMSPVSYRSCKTPRREPSVPNASAAANEAPGSLVLLEKMMQLLSKQTQAIENIATQVSSLGSKSDTTVAELDESFESVPDSTGPDDDFGIPDFDSGLQENATAFCVLPAAESEESALTAQIAEAQKKLAALKTPNSSETPDCEFLPHTMEAEAKLAKADPNMVDQGRRCQRLNEEGWKNIRYAEVQKTFHATPVFAALKVNSHLAAITPNSSSTSQLEKADMTLGAITYGLLLQRKAFREACQNMDPKTRTELQKHLLTSDSAFKKISDGLLQYTCGRRAEIIQTRRETYKPTNRVLSDILHEIPPSDTYLFSEEKLSEAVKDQGGAHKFFPKKTSHYNIKTGRKNSAQRPKGHRDYANKNKKQPARNFRDFRSKQDSGMSGFNKAKTTQAATKKP